MTLAHKLYAAANVGVVVLVPFENLPAPVQAAYQRVADAAELELAGSDASVANARIKALVDILAELLEAHAAEEVYRKGFEFSTSEEQDARRWRKAVTRKAKAALAEAGRRVR